MFICIAVLIELHIACGENRILNSDYEFRSQNSDDASPVPGTGSCSELIQRFHCIFSWWLGNNSLFVRFPSSVERDSNKKRQMMNDLYAGPWNTWIRSGNIPVLSNGKHKEPVSCMDTTLWIRPQRQNGLNLQLNST